MQKRFLPMLLVSSLAVFFLVNFSSCGPKDSAVQASVESALRANPDLSGTVVSVKDGVATISGEVKSEAARAQGETVAKGIKGVKSVVNNITVAAPPPAPAPVVISPDETLNKAVTDALKDYPGVKAEIRDGVVTLTGDIKRSDLQKLMVALNSLKPKKIENKLTIKS